MDQRNVVQALAKGLKVLEVFSPEHPEMTLSEVARAADLDPGTAFRMLNTLVMLGYVEKVADSRRFRLSLKVTDLGFHAIARTDLRDISRPLLRGLVDEVREAASLGVLEGGDILYIERVRAGIARLGVDIRIGTTIPAYCSAIGICMMAYLPSGQVERALAATPRSHHRPIEPVTRDEVDRRVRDARKDGHAFAQSLVTSGLRVLAAPVLDADGFAIAAVSIAAPVFRGDAETFLNESLAPLKKAAHDIGRALQTGGVAASGAA